MTLGAFSQEKNKTFPLIHYIENPKSHKHSKITYYLTGNIMYEISFWFYLF